jgi:hypothetical protein
MKFALISCNSGVSLTGDYPALDYASRRDSGCRAQSPRQESAAIWGHIDQSFRRILLLFRQFANCFGKNPGVLIDVGRGRLWTHERHVMEGCK